MLAGLDLENGRGLEFGALTRPILRRPQHHVLYLDHASTESLRDKYAADPDVDVASLVPVDIVWTGASLRDAVTGDVAFDHVVASHVIEHVPDLITWLAEVRSVLVPGGALRLIVPDRRFTMDVARRETVLAEALAARFERRTRPGAKDIFDFYLNYRLVARDLAWEGLQPGPDGASMSAMALAAELVRTGADGAYHDVHCSVFTPQSFARLMHNLAVCGECPFACERLIDTVHGEIDFFLHLRQSDDPAVVRASWQAAIDNLEHGRPASTLPQDEPAGLRSVLGAVSERMATLTREATAADRQLAASLAEVDALKATLRHQASIKGALDCLRRAVMRRLRGVLG